jgi:hypothetical protein
MTPVNDRICACANAESAAEYKAAINDKYLYI